MTYFSFSSIVLLTEVQLEAAKFEICFGSTFAIPRRPEADFFDNAIKKLLKTKNARGAERLFKYLPIIVELNVMAIMTKHTLL